MKGEEVCLQCFQGGEGETEEGCDLQAFLSE